jgi:cytochrome P450
MSGTLYHARRQLLSHALEQVLLWKSRSLARAEARKPEADPALPLPANPQHPEDFRPLENECFQNPYAFYRLLRDQHPVYQLPNGIYCISRFADIVAVSRDHDTFSSTHQGIIAGLRPGQDVEKAGARMDKLAALGVVPADVLALSDPPRHTAERKVGHKGLNARFVKSLDASIQALCRSMMDEFIRKGRVEFMQEFGWRLPMRLIIQLLGFPATDYERIKTWCMHGIASQSGISTPSELMRSRAATMAFIRYCWDQFRIAQAHPRDDLCGVFVSAVADSDNPMSEQSAVSALFQLLIAGSDSSATSMGNALKLLIDDPLLADEIRGDVDNKLPPFIEEVFRMEAAFQGHFRWAQHDTQLHGVKLPQGSRLFLMWGSGNRDERVFDNPELVDLNRTNGKKHLTFGHGIHACIGRELARSEIRIVLREFLTRTRNLRLDGDAPFLASMFARTLVQLPVAFEPVEPAVPETAQAG